VKAFKGKSIDRFEEVQGFLYLQGPQGLARDLTGFEDGTANPKKLDQKLDAAIISKGSHEGGSFAIVQRWIHNLELFETLPLEDQEKVFGRTKLDSKKLKPMLPESHVTQTDLKDEKGRDLKIVRHSMPFGLQNEHGLLFVGYSNDTHKFDIMLKKMVELPLTIHSMMKYTSVVSGQYYYIPSTLELEGFSIK